MTLDINFKWSGNSFEEVARFMGMAIDEYDPDTYNDIHEKMELVLRSTDVANRQIMILGLKKFLRMLADHHDPYAPFYEGLINLKDDDVLVHLFCANIEVMWV